MSSAAQPIICVETIPPSPTADDKRHSSDADSSSMKAGRSPRGRTPRSSPRTSSPPMGRGEGMMQSGLCVVPNRNMRRKSSPALHGIGDFLQQHQQQQQQQQQRGRQQHHGHHHRRGQGSAKSSSPSPPRLHAPTAKDRRPSAAAAITAPSTTSSSNTLRQHHPRGDRHHHRRLSSPPEWKPEKGTGGGGGSNHSSSHSSHEGSLQQLAIGGLNTSSTDVRSSTIVRSGHQQIQTLYASNDVTYPAGNISINLMNAPDDSTMQCDCGHINCPLCNLMMNLELTDPTVLK